MEVQLNSRCLTEFLVGPELRGIVEERINTAHMLFQAEVAKRTGMLAASAHAHTEIGGVKNDRWTGVLSVGAIGSLGSVDYSASHQFGTRFQPPHRELNAVLDQLGET